MLELKNENMLKRRLNGLVSYYKGINKEVFAEKIIDNVYVPFSIQQEKGYKIAEKLELRKKNIYQKYKTDTYDNFKSNTSLFRIKASNVVYPSYVFSNKLLANKSQ